MATYISIETDKKISYQIDGGDKQTMFANIEDDGYPEPTGTITITENGTGIDVKDYAEADVNVPGGGYPEPTGTITITQNGTGIDVKDYAAADVAVPTYPEPTGTKQISITQNGTTTENVKDYASAEITVNVQGGGQQIGVATPKANPLAMLYLLEHGTAKTGTFTLESTLPNTTTEIFDADDSTVKNFAIFAENADITGTGTTNTTSCAQTIIWLESATIRNLIAIPINNRNDQGASTLASNKDISIDSDVSDLFLYAKWDFVDGVLSVKAAYNHNASYTPFAANVTYRWVAW